MADLIQIRRDTASNWTTANPTLAQGELGIETDTLKIKAGNGSSTWSALGYLINTGGYAAYGDSTANFTGTLQNGGSNVVVDSDIGTTVQAHSTNTALYNNATSNFTGNLQKSGASVLTSVAGQLSSYTGDVNITGELLVDSYNETFKKVTSSSNATTVNCENANVFEHVLTENTTFTFSSPPAAGTATDSTAYSMSLKVVQDASASGYTVTWPTSVDWPAATAPTLTATANAVDQFVFYTYTGGTTWYGFTAGQALG